MTDGKSNYQIGAGKVEITPDKPVPYLAFYPRHTLFKGTHDPLYVRAVVVSDGITEIAIVSTDTIGVSNIVLGPDRNFTKEVRDKICAKTRILPENIMLTSPHIHSAPETIGLRPLMDKNGVEWVEKLQERICDAVAIAKLNTFKANLKVIKGSVDGISYNRRKDDELDTEVVVVLFESTEDDKNIIISHFACHPVIMQVQELVSADYTGVLHDKIEKCIKGCEGSMFLQGACGDIDPSVGNTKNFNDIYLTGTALAGEVIKCYAKAAFADYPTQPVKIQVVSETVQLPSRALPEYKECNEIIEFVESYLHNGLSVPAEHRYKEERYYRIKEGRRNYAGEIQMVRLGDILLTGIPGEPFCRIGKIIKEESRPLIGIPIGYTNDYLGYIAPSSAWDKGGYEVSCGPWSKTGPEGFVMVIESFRKLKQEIKI